MSVFRAQSPDGKYLASGAIDGIINIFDIATGKLLHTLEGARLGPGALRPRGGRGGRRREEGGPGAAGLGALLRLQVH